MKTKHGRRYILVAALMLLGGFESLGIAQSPGSAAIQAEVRAAWDEYLRALSAGRADTIADRVYLAPSFYIAATGMEVAKTPAEVRAHFETLIKNLGPNYQRSETKSANICVLNDTAAVLSGQFIRYRKDGSVLSELAGTYVLAKTAEGWRIVAQMGHSPDRILKCGS